IPLVGLSSVVLAFASCLARKDGRAHIEVETHFAFKVDGVALICSRRKMNSASARRCSSINRLIDRGSIHGNPITFGAEILDVKGSSGWTALDRTTLRSNG